MSDEPVGDWKDHRMEELGKQLAAAQREIEHLKTHNSNQEEIRAAYREQWHGLKPIVEQLQSERGDAALCKLEAERDTLTAAVNALLDAIDEIERIRGAVNEVIEIWDDAPNRLPTIQCNEDFRPSKIGCRMEGMLHNSMEKLREVANGGAK